MTKEEKMEQLMKETEYLLKVKRILETALEEVERLKERIRILESKDEGKRCWMCNTLL